MDLHWPHGHEHADGLQRRAERLREVRDDARGGDEKAELAEGDDRKFHLTCPAHDDDNQSLVAWKGDDGEPHVHCWSHICTPASVFKAIGWMVSRNVEDSVAA